MRKYYFLLSFLLCINYIYAQDKLNIDILIHSNKNNIEFPLNDYVPKFIENKGEEDCIKYNLINSLQEGNSDYIVELWESDEYLNSFIFRETRFKENQGKDGKKYKTSYIAAGIRVKADVDVYMRMIERKTTAVLELVRVDGDVSREIASKEVRNKWRKKASNKALEEMVLAIYDKEISKRRRSIRNDFANSVTSSIEKMVAKNLLPPTKITKIKKFKKNKAKEVYIKACPERREEGDFWRYPVCVKKEIEGFDVFERVGSANYGTEKKGYLSIGKGKKEIFAYLKDNVELYLGKPLTLSQFATSDKKVKDPLNLDFVFHYEKTHPYNFYDMLNLEFMYQSYFMKYRNIRVIAYNPTTRILNETYKKSIFSDNKKTDTLRFDKVINSLKLKTIDVYISNPKKHSFSSDNGVRLFSKKIVSNPAAKRGIVVKSILENGDKKYEETNYIGIRKSKIGYDIPIDALNLKGLHAGILITGVEILKAVEMKKNKAKTVLVLSMSPISKGFKYRVYSKPNFTKKTKKTGGLKINEVLNPYLGIAKVDSGKKEIGNFISKGKKLYTIRKSSGLLGMNGSVFINDYKVVYIKDEKL